MYEVSRAAGRSIMSSTPRRASGVSCRERYTGEDNALTTNGSLENTRGNLPATPAELVPVGNQTQRYDRSRRRRWSINLSDKD